MSLAGKVVVITGSTRGIGRAIATAAAEQGATIVVNGRSTVAVDAAVAELAAASRAASGFAADVSDFAQVEALRDHALAMHGRIDAWVSNAGVSNGFRYLDDETASEIGDLIAVNVLGQLYSAKAIVPYFREHGGYLMNLCGRGWKGDATAFTTAYGASKAASASLTRSLAAENRDCPRLSINAFVPGMVDTDFYHEEMPVSPRLRGREHQVLMALEAFGTPLPDVGAACTALIAAEPGATTGRIYPMLRGARLMRGGMKMAWWGMTGKMRAR